MKRIVLFITAVLLFAGCAKEQLVEERSYTGPVTVVSATFESLSNGATKASVTDAGAFTWQNGDKAAFTVASGSSYLTGTNSSTTATAVFSINGSPSFTSSSFAFYPSDLTTGKSTSSLAVKVPATREWVNGQTNVAMYGVKVENEASFNFSHMGGLVRVRVNNVPTNARKFVFKTPDYKISGDFTVEEESGYKVIKTKTHETENPVPESEQTYTLTWTTAPTPENTMDFYIPLPLGTYANGFAFKFLDGTDAEILSKTSSQSETIARKDLVLMPAITLMGGEIEPAVKAAIVQEVPAGHSGDFLLANSEKVLLKVNASEQDKDITLKYNGGELPTNLEIQVVDDNKFNKKISGDLPKTHVDFTKGEIAEVEMITSSSTFEIVYPAKISEKLTVKGGNVKVKGATVTEIVVVADAKADGDKAPVEIVVEKMGDNVPAVTNGIKANADVVVAPAEDVTVKVTTEGDAKVANGGAGTVKDKDNNDIDTKAAAKIGDIKYITLADAIAAVKNNEQIDIIAEKISATVIPEGNKTFTIDLGGNNKEVTVVGPAVGSSQTMNQAFQILKGNTVTIQNGTINCDNTNNIFRFVIQNYSDLTLNNVTVDGTNLKKNDRTDAYTVSSNFGTITFAGNTTVKASTVSGVDAYAIDLYDYTNHGYTATAAGVWNSDGSITGAITLGGGNLTVSKELKLTKPIKTYKGDKGNVALTVNADIVPADGFTDDALIIVKRGSDVTISGSGKISNNDNTKVYCAVKMTEAADVSSDSESNRAKLTVNGNVTLEGYQAGISGNGNAGRGHTDVTINGSVLVKGCATEKDECCGIYQPQNGTLTINGGTIEGLVGVYVKSGSVTTAVNGGTIKGTGAKNDYVANGGGFKETGDAIVFDNCDYPGGAPNATINGGTFISTNGQAVASYAKTGLDPIEPIIKGGTFSDLSGVQYVAEGTYKLANNVTLATPLEITSGKTFTIDLNSKTLTGRTNIAGANVTFTNGKIAGGNNQAINIYGSETSAENYSVVNISNNVEVSADVYAVCVFGKYNGVGVGAGTTGYGAVANIAGTINTNGDTKNGAIFVSGNLGSKADNDWAVSSKNAVNIQNGAKITSSTDAALALNGSATVTVASGAELTGATAIAAKRGKLIVNGGTITGTMDPGKSNPDTYMNGTEMTGSAVSATASYKADGPLSVEIKDGTFTSKAYTILNNHDGCEFKISGGNFTTTMATKGITVYARLGSVNITGGEFINNSKFEATLHVGCPSADLSNGPKLTISGEDTVVKNTASSTYEYDGGKPLVVNMANQLTYKAVEISGGKFYYRDPSRDDNVSGDNGNFLATDAKVTGDATNGWIVSK